MVDNEQNTVKLSHCDTRKLTDHQSMSHLSLET